MLLKRQQKWVSRPNEIEVGSFIPDGNILKLNVWEFFQIRWMFLVDDSDQKVISLMILGDDVWF